MKVLVTGAAGFIGYHVSKRLADTQSCEVLGVDSLNDYYSVDLKRARLAQLEGHDNFRFVQADFADAVAFSGIYNQFKPDYVVHLGAQANVRYSVDNPGDYVQSNLIGFFNVLEAARANPPKHLVFASSSSVYGETAKTPFDEDDDTSHPLSFYGATKKAGEVMAHSYAHLHGLSLTGLRFFNVYGPWGRPDTAPTLFAQAINEGSSLDLYAEGKQLRDFTYIDDIVDGVLKTLLYPPAEPPIPPFRIFNIGHHRPMEVILFVRMLEQLMGKEAQLNLLPAQAADVPETCASLDKVNAAIGYTPKIPLEDGLKQFVDWFKSYY
ncbi:MAG: UDP-glucuronate 5-epimerase [Opitutaceae bacterium]|nr:UDP-glucuronate 5-epimerase [Opitutaceae bacterium]|tara:strand:+ start:4267 stop:5235 length:969 start_codon:yes stop_codon:yes gene_type:complete